MERSAIIAAALVGFLTTPSIAVEIVSNTTYFTLRGATLAALERDIKRAGPLNPATRLRTPAAVTTGFQPDVRFVPTSGSCSLAVNGVRLKLDYRKPRWRPSGRPGALTRRVYAALETDIRAFQSEQTRIATRSAERLESALRRLRPARDCRTVDARYRQTTIRQLEIHDDQQRRLITRWAKVADRRLRQAASSRS